MCYRNEQKCYRKNKVSIGRIITATGRTNFLQEANKVLQEGKFHPQGGPPLEQSHLRGSKKKLPYYRRKHSRCTQNQGYYKGNKDCYRSDNECYKKGKPHQKGKKKTSKNSRSLIYKLNLDHTTNLLRVGELCSPNFQYNSSLSQKGKDVKLAYRQKLKNLGRWRMFSSRRKK